MKGDRFRGPATSVFERQLGVGRGELLDALAGRLLPAAEALPVAPATARDVWDPPQGTARRVALDDLCARAAADVGQPWPMPLASDAARIHRDGNRDVWEAAAFARQQRLSRAAVAAATTLADAWVDEVANGVLQLCEQSSWCWPAHDDAHTRHGSILADVTDPFVDLGAGEIVAQLAWIDHVLAVPLDSRYPGVRGRIRHEARRRVFAPFVRRRDWHWIGLDGDVHNWSPWIHGNLLVAALRLLDTDEDGRAEVIALAIEGLDRYAAALPDDGAIDEGYAYWWEGACRALEAFDVLGHATGGVLDAVAELPALRNTVAFPHRMHLGGEWYVNVADGRARATVDQPWHALHRAALRVGDSDAQQHAAAHGGAGLGAEPEAAGLGRLLRGLTDADWARVTTSPRPGPPLPRPPLPRDVWLASIEVLVARERAGTAAGLTVAAKGGHNNEHHNHNDVGNFIVASDGVPVIVDAGRVTYTAETFGPDRYSIWPMQSSWHNVPEIRATAQVCGGDAAAADVIADLDEESAELALELAAAYPVTGLRSWRRVVRLERPRRGQARVTIADRWSLEPWHGADEPPTTLRLLIAGTVELGSGGAIVSPLDGATPVRLRWGDVPATVVDKRLDDPLLVDVWGSALARLDLDVTGRDHAEVRVTLDPSRRPA